MRIPLRAARQPPRSGVEPPATGRHRRGHSPSRLPGRSPSRPALLSLLAVLSLLLGSGTAISLTAAAPGPAPPAGPDVAALGSAPRTGTGQAPPASPSPSPAETTTAPEEPEPPAGQEQESEQVDELTALENEVTALTNAERSAAGCGDVETDERLRTAARGHSEDMAVNDYFDHTSQDGRSPFDRMRDAGYPDPAGENIAYGYRTPADVMDGWMNSDGHRDNLLNCSHRAIGVGLVYDAGGRPYWTQVFGR